MRTMAGTLEYRMTKNTARSKAFPRISGRFDVRLRVKRRIDKRGRKLKAFETLREAKKWARRRVPRLGRQPHNQGAALALTLSNCKKSTPCESLACPRCARARRIERSAAILKFLASYPLRELRFLTLINPSDAVPAGKLHQFNPRALITRLRRQLERAGFDKTNCFLIGGVDGEWDEGRRVYQPHIHAVTWGMKKKNLKRLIKSWPRRRRVRNRKRLEPIDDLPRVVAYLEKSFWPCVARKNNPRGIHPHGKQRPPDDIEREILHWFNNYEAANLRLMFGIKSYGSIIVKT